MIRLAQPSYYQLSAVLLKFAHVSAQNRPQSLYRPEWSGELVSEWDDPPFEINDNGEVIPLPEDFDPENFDQS